MQVERLTHLLRQGTGSDPRPSSDCPGDAEIGAFIDAVLGGDEAHAIRRHLAECDFCLARVGFVSRSEEAESPDVGDDLLQRVRGLAMPQPPSGIARSWRWAAAAAAAAALLAFLFVEPWDLLERAEQGPGAVREAPEATLLPQILWPREAAVIPSGQLDHLELRWTGVPEAIFYQIHLVSADGDRVWEGRTETTHQRLPADLGVADGQTIFVWVQAHLTDGKSLQSEVVGFEVGSGEPSRE